MKNKDVGNLQEEQLFLAVIGERPIGIVDDKWNEMDSNAIVDLHLALAGGGFIQCGRRKVSE